MNTYVWDFVLSEGDTISEKFENLYENICTFCLHKTELNPAMVWVNKEIASTLITLHVSYKPIYETLDNEQVFLAEFTKNCGENGCCTDFNLYQDIQCPKDEIKIQQDNELTIIKINNFPF